MQRTTRFMLIAVAGVGLVMVQQLVQRGVLTPRAALQAEVQAELRERAALQRALRPVAHVAGPSATLRGGPEAAALQLRGWVSTTLQACALEQVTTVTPRPFAAIQHGPRRGITTVCVDLRFEANLQQLVNLLEAAYAAPFVTRVERLSIRGITRGQQRTQDRVDVALTLAALLLPPNAPSAGRSADVAMLDAARDYERIATDSMFRLQQVAPETGSSGGPGMVPENSRTAVGAAAAEQVKPRATVWRLLGVSSFDGMPTVFVQNARRVQAQLRELHLGDGFDKGVIVLIDPIGIVVRRDDGPQERYYFYANGRTSAQRVRLTAESHPRLWELLQTQSIVLRITQGSTT